MLTTYLKRQTTCTRYYASPVGPYLDEFTKWLASRGFREEGICNYLPGNYWITTIITRYVRHRTLARGGIYLDD